MFLLLLLFIFYTKLSMLTVCINVSVLRLWKDVTTSLKDDDVHNATAAKHKVLYTCCL